MDRSFLRSRKLGANELHLSEINYSAIFVIDKAGFTDFSAYQNENQSSSYGSEGVASEELFQLPDK